MRIIQQVQHVNDITFIPSNHTYGDRDFWGNVDIHAWAKIRLRDDQRAFRIEYGMTAKEKGWDHTIVTGSAVSPSFIQNGRIINFKLITASEVFYHDNDWELDIFNGKPNELVKQWQILGDRNGPDVGYSQMRMFFNPITFEIEVP